jgi:Uma2 family endonuclease
LSDDAIAVPSPIIVVEVLSPSTSGIDRAFKLVEYFRLPSVRHYLIVWADKQQIVHHRYGDDGGTQTQIVTGGEILTRRASRSRSRISTPDDRAAVSSDPPDVA